LDTSLDRFASEGFTEEQAAKLEESPSMAATWRGDRIDSFFKEAVRNDPRLDHLSITERFKFGPDVFDSVTSVWWDVTTTGEWAAHVGKYTATFGDGVPLLYGGF
jgi:hypothetical protein